MLRSIRPTRARARARTDYGNPRELQVSDMTSGLFTRTEPSNSRRSMGAICAGVTRRASANLGQTWQLGSLSFA